MRRRRDNSSKYHRNYCPFWPEHGKTIGRLAVFSTFTEVSISSVQLKSPPMKKYLRTDAIRPTGPQTPSLLRTALIFFAMLALSFSVRAQTFNPHYTGLYDTLHGKFFVRLYVVYCAPDYNFCRIIDASGLLLATKLIITR
jgi:hypothetical protein